MSLKDTALKSFYNAREAQARAELEKSRHMFESTKAELASKLSSLFTYWPDYHADFNEFDPTEYQCHPMAMVEGYRFHLNGMGELVLGIPCHGCGEFDCAIGIKTVADIGKAIAEREKSERGERRCHHCGWMFGDE